MSVIWTYTGQQHEAHKHTSYIFMIRINTNFPTILNHLNNSFYMYMNQQDAKNSCD